MKSVAGDFALENGYNSKTAVRFLMRVMGVERAMIDLCTGIYISEVDDIVLEL